MADVKKQVMVVAMDDSEHSTYALEWTLDHFFVPYTTNPPFKLMLVHVIPSVPAIVHVGPGGNDVCPNLEANLEKIADGVVEKAKQICISKQAIDVIVEEISGDAKHVLCDAVEKHKAAILVTGSHDHGALKRVVLGSVSDFCAHHAHCTVMIVKKPKDKH